MMFALERESRCAMLWSAREKFATPPTGRSHAAGTLRYA
jgi:hypothetical protein